MEATMAGESKKVISMSKRAKIKGRADSGRFARFPHSCWKHPNYTALSIGAKALLHELNGQYNGSNNGDLSVAWGVVKDRGIGSEKTVRRARDELEYAGWIVLTRQGGRHAPNLYALTFHAIDYCDGKLDMMATQQGLGFWKEGHNPRLSARLKRQEKAA